MFKGIVRLLAFFTKEINEVRRQPRLMLVLILGPFLILLLFGIGYQATPVRPRVALVIPDTVATQFDTTAIKYAVNLTLRNVQDVTKDENAAMAELAAQRVDVVEIIPPDVQAQLASSNSATVEFRYSEINQLSETWIQSLAYGQVNEINKALLANTATQLQNEAKASQDWLGTASRQLDSMRTDPQNQTAVQSAQSGLSQLQNLLQRFSNTSPGALVSPLQPVYKNVLGQTLSLADFYAPAVLALILGHIAVTLGALSLVRERQQGSIELFRVAPVSMRQVLAGKYLAYALFIGVIAAVLAFAMWAIGVPLLAAVLDWSRGSSHSWCSARWGLAFSFRPFPRRTRKRFNCLCLSFCSRSFLVASFCRWKISSCRFE